MDNTRTGTSRRTAEFTGKTFTLLRRDQARVTQIPKHGGHLVLNRRRGGANSGGRVLTRQTGDFHYRVTGWGAIHTMPGYHLRRLALRTATNTDSEPTSPRFMSSNAVTDARYARGAAMASATTAVVNSMSWSL